MFSSVLNSTTASTLSLGSALLCIAAALGLGLVIALTYMLSGKYTKSFAIALVLLPALVQIVIMMVNGNLGVGIAVLGAFSLIRFRSVPGSAKDICTIFFAMAVGLTTGMGYIGYAAVATVIICSVFLLLSRTPFAAGNGEKELKITIPEDLDYTEIFDDIFAQYTRKATLESVKTVNLGSMYQLCYHIALKEQPREKEFIDALRCRNGNLTIVCARESSPRESL